MSEKLGMSFEIVLEPSQVEKVTNFYRIYFPEELKRLADEKRTNFDRVAEFHEVYGCTIGDADSPGWPTAFEPSLRLKLVTEEYNELKEAIEEGMSLDQIAKELADLLYVVYGTGVAMGIDLDECLKRVHESNMSKLGDDGKPLFNSYGKVMKGENYRPPDLTDIVNGTRKTRSQD